MQKVVKIALDWEKVKKLSRNALVFTAPALIVFFVALQNGLSFEKAKYILIVAGYGLVVDFLKKLVSTENVTK